MKYILNSAVITSFGEFSYRTLSLPDAEKFVADEFTSTIGYQQTAEALEMLLQKQIPVNRKQIKMEPGDEAMVFRLTCRLDDPALKVNLSKEFVLKNYELGLLRMTK